MKNIFLPAFLIIAVIYLNAQNNSAKPVTAKSPVILKTLYDSASYAVGLSAGNFYKQQGITKLSTTLISKGIGDILSGKKPLCDDETANKVMNKYMSPARNEKEKSITNKSASILKTLDDSASYVVGLSVANFYKQQGIAKLNTSLISRSINDIQTGKKPLLSDQVANIVMNQYVRRLQEEKIKPVIDAGKKILAQNKLRPGVKTTASGLQYEVITEGNGAKPVIPDSITCHYKGTLMNGTEFDNSYARGQPITFSIIGVISGWTEGLQLMSIGSKYKFYIPYNLAYGLFDYGNIPGGSMLTFEVELLDIKKAH